MSLLLFDLDGTLVETTRLSIPIIQAEIKKYPHLRVPEPKAIQSAFGLPRKEFWELLAPDAMEQEAISIQRHTEEKLLQTLKNENVLLPFAREVLIELKRRGHILSTASNCSTAYLNEILKSQQLSDLFYNPLCIEGVGGLNKKDILTAHFQYLNKSDAFMIGDRLSDIDAAKEHGIPAIACHFGYADDGELEDADYHIHSLKDLLKIFK
jgi:phosphoglycolate phosphatase